MDYEKIARESGYNVLKWSWYYWISPCKNFTSKLSYGTKQEAWKACCEENNLLKEA